MKKKKISTLIESGIMAALSYILNMIVLFQMPQGGSVSLGAMVPLIILSVRRGAGAGILAGAVSGLLQFILGRQFSLHPLSIFLDYIFAYALIGIVGIFGKKKLKISVGIVVAVFLRFVSHVVSGAIVFYEYAGAQNPWIYSIIYNGSFMLPELAITLVLSMLLLSSKQIGSIIKD